MALRAAVTRLEIQGWRGAGLVRAVRPNRTFAILLSKCVHVVYRRLLWINSTTRFSRTPQKLTRYKTRDQGVF